jgi:hypothetical protein
MAESFVAERVPACMPFMRMQSALMKLEQWHIALIDVSVTFLDYPQ